uniref:Uncharacterized protein n=1 Tax=Cacopsylla melanoneura TaxID=428564 RepID=A0A8D8QRX1_9HEMI
MFSPSHGKISIECITFFPHGILFYQRLSLKKISPFFHPHKKWLKNSHCFFFCPLFSSLIDDTFYPTISLSLVWVVYFLSSQTHLCYRKVFLPRLGTGIEKFILF